MITIKTAEEIEIMKEGGRLLAKIVSRLADQVVSGNTGMKIEQLAQEMIKEVGGQPSFPLFTKNYPYATCISIDSAIVHGMATDEKFHDGQIVGLDIGLYYRGLHVDTAVTVGVGSISATAKKLIKVTRDSLYKAIKVVKQGIHVGLIGQTIQTTVEQQGFSIIRQLTGHGVGRKLHEEPRIPNFGRENEGPILKSGMTIAIEPMVSAGDWPVVVDQKDHWTVRLKDGSLGAHFEHTVAITDEGCTILTQIDDSQSGR